MAETYKHLWPEIIDFETLHAAYIKARRGKRYSDEALRFGCGLEEQLLQLQYELCSGTYRVGPYRAFTIREPKRRKIAALPFRDRVVQHALVAVIEPIWEARFIYDSYACRVGKGTHAGADRLTSFLRRAHQTWVSTYVLKADVRSYFASINHEVLRGLIHKRVACRETLRLISEIIDSWEPDSGTGIPIGNLSSQLFANIYLHELDKYTKHTLREHFYLRYMDDFVILSPDKAHLNATQHQIGAFLDERLRLRLNRKTRIFPAECGIDFLGYKIWRTHRLLRKPSIRRMRRRFADFRTGRVSTGEMRATVASWIGHCQHANTYTLRKRVLGGY